MSDRGLPQYDGRLSAPAQDGAVDYLRSGGWGTEFQVTKLFEEELAKAVDARHAVATSSGSSALATALLSIGIRVGDEVIVPNLTMAATAQAVQLLGAVPVLADVEPQSLTLCPERVREKITPRTRAIIHVSLNGRAGKIYELLNLCKDKNLPLIEDAAQALTSSAKGKALGTIGHCGIYSFSSPKIITTGQGGMLVTNNSATAEKARWIKNFGRPESGSDSYEVFGFNFKFNDVLAALGRAQIEELGERARFKKSLWKLYSSLLCNIPEIHMIPGNDPDWVPWFIEIHCSDRENLKNFLSERGIGTRQMYPALHSQPAFAEHGIFPVSSAAAQDALWLPSSFDLKSADVERVSNAIASFFHRII